MNLPSGSNLQRALLCPESQVLPHFRSGDTPWSQRGKVIHAFLVRVAEVGREEALLELEGSEHYEACECIEVDRLPAVSPSSYAYEVALAWDIVTGQARELGRDTGRDYSGATKDEVVCTIDVLGLTPDAVLVCDYKSGFKWFGPSEENPQLLFAALAACIAYGRDRAWLAIIRIDEEGRPYFIWGEVTRAQLEDFAARLRQLDERISELRLLALGGEPLRPTWGDHCNYCPALPSCPAHMTLARSMSNPEDDTAGLPLLTRETVPLYLVALSRTKKLTERIEGSVKAFAKQMHDAGTPVELGGGQVYGPHAFPIDEWDVQKALPILQDFLWPDAWRTIDSTVVKKNIKEVYRERKKADRKVLIEKSTDMVLAALRNQGAVTTRYTYPIGAHKPKPELEEANGEEGTAAAG